MSKFAFVIILSLFCRSTYAQKSILEFKKGRKIISTHWEGAEIAFLLQDGEWKKGIIKKINKDSIYILP
jgi:hypothetical protein